MFRFLKNSYGISLMEVVVALGLMGAGSVVMMQMNKNQTISQKRVEETAEISTVSNLISQALVSDVACLNSLGAGTPIVNGESIPSIKNIGGAVIIESGEVYGNGLISVKSIKITNTSFEPEIAGKIKGSASLLIEFIKKSRIVQGKSSAERRIIKRFPISFTTDPTKKLLSCFDTADGAIESALIESCKSIGGVLNTSNQCILQDFNGSQNDYTAVSTKNLKDFMNDSITSELDPRYINSQGNEQLTGTLNVSGNLSSDTAICVNGRCRKFEKIACPVGEVATEINEDGSVVCVSAKVVLAQSICGDGAELKKKPAPDNSLYCDSGCVDSSWAPEASTICEGQSFTQTSQCGTTRGAIGTKGTWGAWTDVGDPALQCPEVHMVTKERFHSCTNERETQKGNGTKDCSVRSCSSMKIKGASESLPVAPEGTEKMITIMHESNPESCTMPNGTPSVAYGTTNTFECKENQFDSTKVHWRIIKKRPHCGLVPVDNGQVDYCKDRYGPTATGSQSSGCCWTANNGQTVCQ